MNHAPNKTTQTNKHMIDITAPAAIGVKVGLQRVDGLGAAVLDECGAVRIVLLDFQTTPTSFMMISLLPGIGSMRSSDRRRMYTSTSMGIIFFHGFGSTKQ